MIIRPAGAADALELRAIYAPFVEKTAITFEYETPSPEEFERRIRTIGARFPWLAAEAGGRPAGYAYASVHQERAAYQWDADLSVYLRPEFAGRGLGSVLYGAVIEILRLQGYQNVCGLMTLPNPASERLHLGLDFRLVGISRRAGYKLGGWHDVAWFEKAIGDYPPVPAPPKPVTELDPEILAGILKRAESRLKENGG